MDDAGRPLVQPDHPRSLPGRGLVSALGERAGDQDAEWPRGRVRPGEPKSSGGACQRRGQGAARYHRPRPPLVLARPAPPVRRPDAVHPPALPLRPVLRLPRRCDRRALRLCAQHEVRPGQSQQRYQQAALGHERGARRAHCGRHRHDRCPAQAPDRPPGRRHRAKRTAHGAAWRALRCQTRLHADRSAPPDAGRQPRHLRARVRHHQRLYG